MKNKKKIVMVLFLLISLVIVIITSIYINKYNYNIEKILITDNSNMFAIYVEEAPSSEEYVLSNNTPGSGYTLNNRRSNCIDIEGNMVDATISYDSNTGNISVDLNKSAVCYIYFDMNQVNQVENFSSSLITNGNMWASGLEGDGYRYIGTSPNNYVCFGTTNKGICINNPNEYLYRIIGVFTDNNKNHYAKIIKNTPLDQIYKYHNDEQADNFFKTELYNGLNGSYYLRSDRYNYLQNNIWNNKIANWSYVAVNTKTNENTGLNYGSISPQHIYLHELNLSGKSSTVGTWTSEKSKIGLMYASDYALSLGSLSNQNSEALKTSWLYNGDEWLISEFGKSDESSYFYSIDSTGSVEKSRVINTLNVRPTFYLEASTQYSGGNGSKEDPYILDIYVLPNLDVTYNNDERIIKIDISSDDFAVVSYCINNNETDTSSCIWHKDTLREKQINYEPQDLIYVHIKDMYGRIIHSKQLDTR